MALSVLLKVNETNEVRHSDLELDVRVPTDGLIHRRVSPTANNRVKAASEALLACKQGVMIGFTSQSIVRDPLSKDVKSNQSIDTNLFDIYNNTFKKERDRNDTRR